MSEFIKTLDTLGMGDVDLVGGKNASLGEMIVNLTSVGVSVPGGFAITTTAYRCFIESASLNAEIHRQLEGLDVEDIGELSRVGGDIRRRIESADFPPELEKAIESALSEVVSSASAEGSFAVRSSATAEDMPDASFAGQQESFLNIRGRRQVVGAVKRVFGSLFNDRAIAYRAHHGFDEKEVAISVAVQQMVRSDLAVSGVMFSLDTESGFDGAVFITGSYGLGEAIVQGAVNPDEFYLYKPNLRQSRPAVLSKNLGSKSVRMVFGESDSIDTAIRSEPVPEDERSRFILDEDELHQLGRHALAIEDHYGRPMDIEWAKDGKTGELFIVQARPETVQSRSGNTLERFTLERRGDVLVEGRAVGQKIAAGPVRLVMDVSEMTSVAAGDILVTDMTDPDWEPVMKRAGAIVTNRGGRTCHAAIIARELGLPAVVGCRDATKSLTDGQRVTVSCAEGDTGYIYDGQLDFSAQTYELDSMPPLPVEIMMNIANPERAFHFSRLPNSGVGLARLEFIINNAIGIHPKALLELESLPASLQDQIRPQLQGHSSGADFFVEKLTQGISMLAAAFAPEKVIVRLSDFKSNEYRHLLGGDRYEPIEENPMIGFRGASRYLSPEFADCFALECEALRRVRDQMGLRNVEIMVPFVRTVRQGERVVALLTEHGLERGVHGLKLIMMCEIPANVILAEQFLEHFDGFSIGSNDLTQLTLGLDRDSALVADLFDERNEAVRRLIADAIAACKKTGKYIGICGQAPSDYPEIARWLVDEGIDSLSLNPDTVVSTWLDLAGQSLQPEGSPQ